MKKFGKISCHINKYSFAILWLEFLAVYIALGVIFGIGYYSLQLMFPSKILFDPQNLSFFEAQYFSFITQLTVGYGDFTPVGISQWLTVIQSLLGVALFGIWAGLAIIKMVNWGHRDSILLSDWAGYSLEEERFFVLFVNRNEDDLVDVNINSIIKVSDYNTVYPNVNPPYIGKSAWTFAIQELKIDRLKNIELFENDGIKISISGTAGISRCTNWRKYKIDKIYVVENRNYFWDEIFTNPKFDQVFFENFMNPPNGAVKFSEYNFNG